MRLKRLEISGFKSFAKKSVFEFGSPISAIVGPNGSGKCVTGDTLVQLRSGERRPIRELVEAAEKTAQKKQKYKDGHAIISSGVNEEVAALNMKTQRIEWRPISAFVRRSAPRTLQRITTRSGRTITATPYHPLFTLRGGEIKALRADEVGVGTRIATPRTLPTLAKEQELPLSDLLNAFSEKDHVYIPHSPVLAKSLETQVENGKHKTRSAFAHSRGITPQVVQRVHAGQSLNIAYAAKLFPTAVETQVFSSRTLKSKGTGELVIPKKVDTHLARFLGYIIAEGRNARVGHVWFTNDDRAVLTDYFASVKQSFGITPKEFSYKPHAKDVIIFSLTLCRLLEHVFQFKMESKSKEKRVPTLIERSPNTVVAAFLSALFAGDGHFSYTEVPRRRVYMEYATASSALAHGVRALLLRFGINAQVHEKQKYAANTKERKKRTYYSVFVYGDAQLRQLAEVLDIPGKKGNILARFRKLEGIRNANLDCAPDVCTLVRSLVRDAGVSVKPHRKECPTLAAYCERRCEATREGIQRVLAVIDKYGDTTSRKVQQQKAVLERIATSDVFWDEVVSVEEVVGTGDVYDLTVGEHHNFIANDMFVHNSNVAESIRFVLGEQSMKSLRGKRGEDLVWSGSNTAGRSNVASVKLVFDNNDRTFDMDYDEVSVRRDVHRDGSNQYFINGSQVRLRDVIELLAQVHIGASSHHIISQGEADRILNANPKERRGMIEDALGLKVYHWKIDESEKKLKKTEENIKEVQSLRREITPHLKYLKRQVEKIEKAREMREKLKTLYAEYLKREDIYITKERSRIEQAQQRPESRLAQVTEDLAKAREELNTTKHADPKAKELAEIESRLSEARSEKNELTKEVSRVEGMIEYEKKRRAKQQEKQEEDKVVPLAKLRRFVDEFEGTLSHASVPESPDAFQSFIDRMKQQLRSFFEQVREASGSQDEVFDGGELQELEQKYANFSKQLEEATERETKLQEAYNTLQKEIEAQKDDSRQLERSVYEMMAQKSELTAEVDKLRGQKENIEKAKDAFNEELKEGSALIGRGVLSYEQFTIDEAEVLAEPREKQEERRKEIEKIKIKLEEEGLGNSDEVLKEYEETSERDAFLANEIADLEQSAESLRSLIADLTERLDKEFKEGVDKINTQFQEFFALMFGGGNAKLVIVAQKKRKQNDMDALLAPEGEDQEDEEGIDIAVSLPRKKIKGLQMLSGGERALTSIALIFAVSQVNPPPFLVLDETDAALDEANSRRYGDMLENLSQYSQLIVITHNRETMSHAGVLYGVTMGSDAVSKLLSVKFDEASQYAK